VLAQVVVWAGAESVAHSKSAIDPAILGSAPADDC
jgi:hypothetical protein